ncbi:hypothetical protein FGW37_29015 [Streptomyces rectiverticillatus]|uniref:hypothetical protein n=1 Tax=Streptomyces rectiverticillatus TaxID=173860 RepID=UPI0015C3AE44|nr:hypothetical protein [Streptomyces rectiverticillatus]QLE75111.1 hypothetical protein FGW37_29015 [Streptomyces rectiverticillatus]
MNPDRLYALLPAVHRRMDERNGGQLRALLSVIAEQAGVVEADIERMYDDWFIETCDEWVVPYLGALIGYALPPGAAAALAGGTEGGDRLLASAVPRREVADTVANRRRKGTLALLEDLAADVAGWPARAVEHRRLLALTQPVRRFTADDHGTARRLRRGGLADLRRTEPLNRTDGPFDELAHTAEMPRACGTRRAGRYNIPGLGLHIWRLQAHSQTRAPAFCLDRAAYRFTFSVLGNDTRLFTLPVPEPSPCHIAGELNVPAPIGRRSLTERLHDYYGPGKSMCVWEGDGDGPPVALERIVSADLSGWDYRTPEGKVAVDPVLGRIAFPARQAPEQGVRVTYHHGAASDIGGGEYPRPYAVVPEGESSPYRVGPGETFARITDAVEQWRADHDRWRAGSAPHQGDGPHQGRFRIVQRTAPPPRDPGPRPSDVIEISGNDVHQDVLDISLHRGDRLVLRAADGARPVLRLLDWSGSRPDALRITGTGTGEGPPPTLTLDGLMVTGRCIRIHGDVGGLLIRHCTLVPGWDLDERCRPREPEEPSLELVDTPADVRVEHSVLGTVVVRRNEPSDELQRIHLSDSALDATARTSAALTGPEDRQALAVLTAHRTTVIGTVHVHSVDLVENCLFDGDVHVVHGAAGCVRFCWLPPGSRTPRRFHCEPEHSGTAVAAPLRFTSTRYGTPGYLQLADGSPDAIRRGADDGSEPGALHDLFQPQREDNLRTRLAEYAPAGCDPALVFVT